MSFSNGVSLAIISGLAMDGVDIVKADVENEIIWLAIPKESFAYLEYGNIHDAASYAKRIKEMFIDAGFSKNLSVRYAIKNIVWTKEMGEKNLEKLKTDLLMGSFGKL